MLHWKNALVEQPRLDFEHSRANWTIDELAFFKDLFNVMQHMCSCLWPDELEEYKNNSLYVWVTSL